MAKLKRMIVPAGLLLAAYWAVFGGEYSVFEVRRARLAREAETAELERIRHEIDSLATLTDSPHAITIAEGEDASGPLLACGEIGGRLTDTGFLVVALRSERSRASAGIAVLAPGLESPDTTGVSVFLIGAALPTAEGSLPVAVEGTPTG